jgi:hypothetical protein
MLNCSPSTHSDTSTRISTPGHYSRGGLNAVKDVDDAYAAAAQHMDHGHHSLALDKPEDHLESVSAAAHFPRTLEARSPTDTASVMDVGMKDGDDGVMFKQAVSSIGNSLFSTAGATDASSSLLAAGQAAGHMPSGYSDLFSRYRLQQTIKQLHGIQEQ